MIKHGRREPAMFLYKEDRPGKPGRRCFKRSLLLRGLILGRLVLRCLVLRLLILGSLVLGCLILRSLVLRCLVLRLLVLRLLVLGSLVLRLLILGLLILGSLVLLVQGDLRLLGGEFPVGPDLAEGHACEDQRQGVQGGADDTAEDCAEHIGGEVEEVPEPDAVGGGQGDEDLGDGKDSHGDGKDDAEGVLAGILADTLECHQHEDGDPQDVEQDADDVAVDEVSELGMNAHDINEVDDGEDGGDDVQKGRGDLSEAGDGREGISLAAEQDHGQQHGADEGQGQSHIGGGRDIGIFEIVHEVDDDAQDGKDGKDGRSDGGSFGEFTHREYLFS